ncbi:MAG: tetratricopeptide repeat protein [Candidatus Adiutrix sp.]|jgi:tetratricopeptide (TPR) repeat protein|nr:tetratricopeptide repeat protein [Candidatus Adiutrix sp.]
MTHSLKITLGATLLLAAMALVRPAPLPAQMDSGPETAGTTPIALVEEAYLAHRRGNYAEAIKGYTSIIQRRGLTRRERAISYLLRGEAKRDAKELDEAIVDFTRALRQWPGYPQAHFFRGRVYEDQGKLMEAYADIYKAAQLEPGREAYDTTLALLRRRMAEEGLTPPADDTPLEPVSPEITGE